MVIPMTVSGKMITSRGTVHSMTQMVISTKANGKMRRKKAREIIPLKMEIPMKVNGKVVKKEGCSVSKDRWCIRRSRYFYRK